MKNMYQTKMWVLTLSIAFWFGYEVITITVRNRLDYMTRVFGGIPLGILYQSLVALILQLYFPWSLRLNIIVNISLAIPTLIMHIVNTKISKIQYTISFTLTDLVALFLSMSFVLYRLNFMLVPNGETGGCCYSDYSFHYDIISSFAFGMNQKRSSLFDFKMPISYGNKMVYPILPNFYAAFLIATCNLDTNTAFRIPTFFVAASWVFLLHKLALTFTNSSAAAALAMPLWIFSGGLGFIELYEEGLKDYYDPENYIHTWTHLKNAFWFQSLTNILNPQRSATYVLPICALTLICLIKGVKRFEMPYFILAALCVGITPQTQVHAYVSLALFSIALSITTFKKKKLKKIIQCWFVYGVTANVIALPLFYPFLERSISNTAFLTFNPIWKDPKFEASNIFVVYWYALGCCGLISLIFGFFTANLFQIRIYLANLFVLLIATTIMFQPWELDNTKLLHDAWFPVAVAFVAQYFVFIFDKCKSILLRIIFLIVYLSCLLSGILNLKITEPFIVEFYSGVSKIAGQWAAENTPVESVGHFMTYMSIPFTTFAGRQQFCGWLGWIKSHGIINSTRNGLLNQLNVPKSPDDYVRENITYLLMGMSSKPYLDQPFIETVFELSYYQVNRIRPELAEKPKPRKKKKYKYDSHLKHFQ